MLFSKNKDDIQRFQNMVADRRAIIDNASNAPLPKTYVVNEMAKSLHPGRVEGEIIGIQEVGRGCKKFTIRSKSGKFPFFRAGQFITLTSKVGSSIVTRPYSISSSPYQALDGILEVIVQRNGFYSEYLCDRASIGESIIVGEPSGDFYHDDLRDRDTLFAIAGGSGVTPFISMIKSIIEGSESFKLVLVYGARTEQDLLIDPEVINNENIKIHVVLSHERSEKYEHGFITKDILKRTKPENCSTFICGPDAMYSFVIPQLIECGIEKHSIRKEHNSVGNHNLVDNPKEFTLKVRIRDKVYEIPAKQNETLITALERAGIPAPVRCKSGVCGFCHSRLISGDYFVPERNEHRRKADLKFGFIHPCCTYPESDMEIDVPIVGGID